MESEGQAPLSPHGPGEVQRWLLPVSPQTQLCQVDPGPLPPLALVFPSVKLGNKRSWKVLIHLVNDYIERHPCACYGLEPSLNSQSGEVGQLKQ